MILEMLIYSLLYPAILFFKTVVAVVHIGTNIVLVSAVPARSEHICSCVWLSISASIALENQGDPLLKETVLEQSSTWVGDTLCVDWKPTPEKHGNTGFLFHL